MDNELDALFSITIQNGENVSYWYLMATPADEEDWEVVVTLAAKTMGMIHD